MYIVTKNKVRIGIGRFFVLAHLFCIGFIFYESSQLNAGWDDALQTALVVAPIFLGYTAAIVKHIIKFDPTAPDTSAKVGFDYCLFLWLFAVALVGTILYLYYYSHLANRQFSPEQARIGIGAVEAGLGIYLGFFMTDLFNFSPPAAPQGGPTNNPVPQGSVPQK